MIEVLLYANLNCIDAADIIGRTKASRTMSKIVITEIVQTIKEATPHCKWDANGRRNGKTDPAKAEKVNFPFF